MTYHDLLNRYGSEAESAEQRIFIYAQAPQKLKTAHEIIYRDRETENKIAELERYIEALKDYRQALAARYNELETMPYSLRLKLERCPHWKGHIEYYITITKVLQDGNEINELREKYSGKERRKAIDRFEELKKQRPGIESVKDINKRSWEK